MYCCVCSKRLCHDAAIYNNVNHFATLLELYSNSLSPFKQQLSEKNFGMGMCQFLAAMQAGMD
jgi:hypothetical protein